MDTSFTETSVPPHIMSMIMSYVTYVDHLETGSIFAQAGSGGWATCARRNPSSWLPVNVIQRFPAAGDLNHYVT